MKPTSARIFMWVGIVLWLLVTAAAIVLVAQSPADHAGMALGVLLIWVVLVVFAGFARLTEHVGRGPR